MKPKTAFQDISINFSNALVVVDVDGTLAEDGAETFSQAIINKLEEIKTRNRVYLSSNTQDVQRKERIQSTLSTPFTDSAYRKPNPNMIAKIQKLNEKVVVIGDKVLTDGLLAKRLHAQFIKVRRQTTGNESFKTKLINALDDCAASVVRI